MAVSPGVCLASIRARRGGRLSNQADVAGALGRASAFSRLGPPSVDRAVFSISLGCVVGASVPMILYPQAACGRRGGHLLLDRQHARPLLHVGLHLRQRIPGVAGLQPPRGTGARRRSGAGLQHLQLDGHAVLRRHRLRPALLVHRRVGLLRRSAPVRRGTGQRRGPRMGRHLRHLPLGSLRVGAVLPADGGHRLALLPLPAAASTLVRRLDRPLRQGLRQSPVGKSGGRAVHPGADRRHGHVARPRHADARRRGGAALRHRRIDGRSPSPSARSACCSSR